MTATTGNPGDSTRDASHVAAFFDLDKTIIATNSAFAYGKVLFDHGYISAAEAFQIYLTKKAFMRSGMSSDKMDSELDHLTAMVTGWNASEISRVIDDAYHQVISPALYAEALELIDEHRAAGHDVVIVSASVRQLVEPIARELGIADLLTSELEVRDGHFTGAVINYLKGPAKADAIRALATSRGYDLTACYAYSDSTTDIPFLELVGHPMAVNPEAGLRAEAARRGWAVRQFAHPKPLVSRPSREVTLGAGVAVGLAAVGAAAVWFTQRK
ncbi:HAD family hydrolase [Corynebacterium uterequi]|uniref:HAD-superfamily subfamily IB hydrolase, TIGR01490 n=1 Tax=Corynebacterium uterequi TaxID=1072256 RepID=A0A0G3HGF4_9CORY|nr:HAD family hydrolase [Corynebacterium uterequi]AKK10197.1 HAD-superfamily subfamily IB hydrolase, TIGR01490 [Corynebacterium uterequi]